MTRHVLFVQGGGEGTHEEWDSPPNPSVGGIFITTCLKLPPISDAFELRVHPTRGLFLRRGRGRTP
jgi:hypothetical protein